MLICLLVGTAIFYFWPAPPMKDLSDGIFPHVFDTRNPELKKELKRLYDEKLLPKQQPQKIVPNELNTISGLKKLWDSEEYKNMADECSKLQRENAYDTEMILEEHLPELTKIFFKNKDVFDKLNSVLNRPDITYFSRKINVYFRESARKLGLRLNWALASNRPTVAIESLSNIFLLGNILRKEKTIMALLISLAIKDLGLEALHSRINFQSNKKNLLNEMHKCVAAQLTRHPNLSQVYKNEQIMCLYEYASLKTFVIMGNSKYQDWDAICGNTIDGNFHKAWEGVRHHWKILFYKLEKDLAVTLKIYDEQSKIANLPYYRQKSAGFPCLSSLESANCLIAALSVRAIESISRKVSKQDARLKVINIALSKRLGKEIDKKNLINPMTGAPFKIEESDEKIKVTAEDAGMGGNYSKDYVFEIKRR